MGIGLRLAVVMPTAELNVAFGLRHPLDHRVQLRERRPHGVHGAPGQHLGWVDGRGTGLARLGPTGARGIRPLAVVSALIRAVLVSGWHVHILLLKEGGLQTFFQLARFALHAWCLDAISGPCVSVLAAPHVSQ